MDCETVRCQYIQQPLASNRNNYGPDCVADIQQSVQEMQQIASDVTDEDECDFPKITSVVSLAQSNFKTDEIVICAPAIDLGVNGDVSSRVDDALPSTSTAIDSATRTDFEFQVQTTKCGISPPGATCISGISDSCISAGSGLSDNKVEFIRKGDACQLKPVASTSTLYIKHCPGNCKRSLVFRMPNRRYKKLSSKVIKSFNFDGIHNQTSDLTTHGKWDSVLGFPAVTSSKRIKVPQQVIYRCLNILNGILIKNVTRESNQVCNANPAKHLTNQTRLRSSKDVTNYTMLHANTNISADSMANVDFVTDSVSSEKIVSIECGNNWKTEVEEIVECKPTKLELDDSKNLVDVTKLPVKKPLVLSVPGADIFNVSPLLNKPLSKIDKLRAVLRQRQQDLEKVRKSCGFIS